MASLFVKRHLILSLLFIPNVFAQSYYDTTTDPTKRVEYALSGLGQWYNITTGIWETAGWWNKFVSPTLCSLLCVSKMKRTAQQDSLIHSITDPLTVQTF
jgi:hypothetical protein